MPRLTSVHLVPIRPREERHARRSKSQISIARKPIVSIITFENRWPRPLCSGEHMTRTRSDGSVPSWESRERESVDPAGVRLYRLPPHLIFQLAFLARSFSDSFLLISWWKMDHCPRTTPARAFLCCRSGEWVS